MPRNVHLYSFDLKSVFKNPQTSCSNIWYYLFGLNLVFHRRQRRSKMSLRHLRGFTTDPSGRVVTFSSRPSRVTTLRPHLRRVKHWQEMFTLWDVPVLVVLTRPFSTFVASRPTFCRHTAVSVDAEEVESSCQKGKISTAGHNSILRNCHLTC